MFDDDNHNNHHGDVGELIEEDVSLQAAKGAHFKLGDLEREDGQLTEIASRIGKNNVGVLIKAMSAIDSDKEYRQILKSGNYKTREKARQAVKAIDECRRFGYYDGIRSILDDITAQSAGENMALLREILKTLTHTDFTLNRNGNMRKSNERNASPLS